MNLHASRLCAALLPTVLLLSAACQRSAAPPTRSLVADPPPTEDGLPPGAGLAALDRGVAYIKAEAWAKALPQFDTLLLSNDKNAQAHYYRALALKNLGRANEAEAGFEKAITLDASLIEARMHLGELLLLAEPPNPEKAITTLTPVLEAQPRAKDTRELLAYAHLLLEHWSEAADHYAVVVQLEDTKELRYQLADTLYRAGRLPESVVQMRKIFPAFVDDLKIVAQLAHRFGKAKAFDDCVSGFDAAIALNAREAAFFLHRGLCKHGLKDEKGARLDFVAAIEVDTKFQPAYFYLGKSWLHEQRSKRAVEAFKKCVQLGPETKIAQRAQRELDRMRASGKR